MMQRCGQDFGELRNQVLMHLKPNEQITWGWIIWRRGSCQLPASSCMRFFSMKVCVPLKNGETPRELIVRLLDVDVVGADWDKESTVGPLCFPSMIVKKFFNEGRERVAVYPVAFYVPRNYYFRFENVGQTIKKAYMYGAIIRPRF